MSLRGTVLEGLRLPVVGAPLFILSQPDLVIAQCQAGVVGSFPALNARPEPLLEEWLLRITNELAAWDAAHPEAKAAPFAVNQIVHKSNDRLERDLALCVKYKVPVVITSLGAREDINRAVHSYGGIVLHDVIHLVHAKKALERGADGLIAVAAGAGGHAGTLSPIAFIEEIRAEFDGPLLLSGSIATGRGVLAAQVLGADLAYIGSAFIATAEANASVAYKQAIVDGTAADIVYTNLFTGVHGNYLRASIVAAGLDPDNLPTSDPSKMSFGSGGASATKAWRDIWGCGQGIGAVRDVLRVRDLVARLTKEYAEAKARVRGLIRSVRVARVYVPGAVALLLLACSKDPPLTPEEDEAQLFRNVCARCHGQDGRGGPGDSLGNPGPRNFTDSAFQRERTDAQLKETILNGKRGMPAFGAVLTADQLDRLTAHVRRFGPTTTDAAVHAKGSASAPAASAPGGP